MARSDDALRFSGEYSQRLDDKSRVIFPQRLRESVPGDDLPAGFVATRGFEGSLRLYPKAAWNGFADRVALLPDTRRDARNFQRLFLAPSQLLTLDRQNRFLIPESLCRIAGIDSKSRDVVFVGVGACVELWSKERYEAWEQAAVGAYEDLAESVFHAPSPGGEDSTAGSR